MTLISFFGYSQLNEGFEGALFPPTGWIKFDNGIGTAQSWNFAPSPTFAYAGNKAAYMNRENVTDGTTSLDWLVTSQVTVPANGQLRFFTRKTLTGNFGSIYTIRVSTASQNTVADFTTIQTYTELDLGSIYEQKFVDLTPYIGQNIYVAFVLEQDNGDRWLVDNVNIDSKCISPTVQTVSNISDTSVDLGWNNPGGASEWDIEWGPAGFAQGTGTTVSNINSNPYKLSGLTAATNYRFYVRANCGNNNIGDWFGPFNFTTGICSVASQCDFIFRLTDSFGDGWNGSTMLVRQLGVTIATLGPTFTAGSGPINITVPLCSGQPFELFWSNGGGFPSEVGVQIIDPLSAIIYTKAPGTGTPNTVLFSGPAQCTPPTCPKPSNILFSSLTQTSGTISWSDNTSGNATLWNVIIQPVGTGYPPLGTTPTAVVSGTNYNFSGLVAGTQYEVYISAVCDAATVPDPSIYEGPVVFATLIANDECINAIIAPVNENSACLSSISGTIVGATASPIPNACTGTADDDVWYQFTAIGTTHSISLLNVAGSTTNLNHAVYSGACGTLTQIACSDPNASIVNGLTVGQVYFIRIYSSGNTPNQTTTFDLCIGTPASCDESLAFCGETGLTYTNSVNSPSYGGIGCLFTTPNPSWYFMQVNQSGSLNFQIAQTSNITGNGIDVDYIVWGPFTPAEFAASCNDLNDFPDGNVVTPNNIASCSYSAAAIENFVIPNAIAGNIYLVLITNFSNQQGTVTFTQTGGTGNTNCDIVCSVDLGPNQTLCNQATTTITATTSGATNYQWYFNNVLIPGVNSSTITVSQSGTYKCQLTCGINIVEDQVVVTFNDTVIPTFTQPAALCTGAVSPTLPLSSNNGIFGTWSPAIVDNTNSATYTFTPDAGQCASSTTLDIIVNPKDIPSFVNPGVLCIGAPSVALPTTSGNGYTGNWTLAGNPVTNVDTATAGNFVYTFTPNPASQCAAVTTLIIEISAACTFNAYATAVWLQNCENTATNGDFYNVTGSGTSLIGPASNIFPSSELGNYVQNSGKLVLRGGELKSFKTATSNVCSARLNYRVYQVAATPGAFTIVDLPFFDDCNAVGSFPTGGACSTGDQKWQKVSANGDLVFAPDDLTDLAPDNYIIETFFDLTGDSNSTGCDETIFVNNGGANFKATFSISAIPTFASTNPLSCNSSDGTITISGLTTNEIYSVTYTDDAVAVSAQNYTANAAGTITISGLNAGTYTNFNFGISGCTTSVANSVTLVNPVYTPTFNPVGPFCVNQVVTLPVASIEGYNGSWLLNGNPVTSFDTSAAGTFVLNFVPDANQCANNLGTVIVLVNPIPTVTNVTAPAICFGSDAIYTITSSPNTTVNYSINGGAAVDLPIGVSGSAQVTVTAPPVGNVVLVLNDINNGSCTTVVNTTHTIVVNPLPTATISAPNSFTCAGSNAIFNVTGTPNSVVTYTINGGTAQTVTLTNAGTAVLDLPSAINVEVILVSVFNPATSCSNLISGQVANVAILTVPVPTATLTQACASGSGVVEVTSPLISQLNFPGNLFISEAQPGAITYVEIYNLTGAPVDLSNYRLMVYLNGALTTPAANNVLLSGILANDDVVVIRIGAATDEGGVVPDLAFPLVSGVNNNDRIVLADAAGVAIDTWGTLDNSAFTISAQGYNYKRVKTGTVLPTNTFNVADWIATDWLIPSSTQGDYSDVGSYSLFAASYEYILSDGTTSVTQTTTTFNNVAPGNYTLVVHDTTTNCSSLPYSFTITGPTPSTFNTITLCEGDLSISLPTASLEGYAGTWELSGNPVTSIDTAVAGNFTYTFIPAAGQCALNGSLTVDISSKSPVTFDSVDACLGTQVSFPTQSIEGYQLTGTWTPSVINNTTAGVTTYTFVPNDVCYGAAQLSVTLKSCTIPKGFSPNGDGNNDTWNLASFNVKKVEVFNRYGLKVYSKSNYTNEWGGDADNGNELPTGTYYYMIEFNDRPTETGWVYINRGE